MGFILGFIRMNFTNGRSIKANLSYFQKGIRIQVNTVLPKT